MMTLASCGTSGSATKVDLRETLRLPKSLETCFDETLVVPPGTLSRKGIMELNGKASDMDIRKSACGRNVITRYKAVVDMAAGDEGNKAR